MKRIRGFTVIELLIVIAIIVALATVIISAVRDARTDGIVAKMTAEMDGVKKRAAVVQNQAFTFSEVCGSDGATQDTQIADFIIALNDFSPGTTTCNSSLSDFAISVPLPPDSSEHWCVDGTGDTVAVSDALVGGALTCS